MHPIFLLYARDGHTRVRELAAALDADGRASAGFAGATWQLALTARKTVPGVQRCSFAATVTQGAAAALDRIETECA